jgi:hypothetical protein
VVIADGGHSSQNELRALLRKDSRLVSMSVEGKAGEPLDRRGVRGFHPNLRKPQDEWSDVAHRYPREPPTCERLRLTSTIFLRMHISGGSHGPEHQEQCRGAAGRRFGDCLSYAVVRLAIEPLLFVGEYFARTDIAPA